MADIVTYSRRLTREDVETGSVFITKDRWRLFPQPLEEFTVVVGAQTFRTCVVAEECACVSPPHKHYHLEVGHFRHMLDFRRGRTVVVRREPDGRYRVETPAET